MKIDMWYGNSKKDIAALDVFFYPESGKYRGNLYDAAGNIIGDYATSSSLEIEKVFNKIFSWN